MYSRSYFHLSGFLTSHQLSSITKVARMLKIVPIEKMNEMGSFVFMMLNIHLFLLN